MAVKKAYESKASEEEVNRAAAKSEGTQLQLRATKELELELRAKQDHDKTVAKTAEAEERAIQEKLLVSKTSIIPDWRESIWLNLSVHFSLFFLLKVNFLCVRLAAKKNWIQA